MQLISSTTSSPLASPRLPRFPTFSGSRDNNPFPQPLQGNQGAGDTDDEPLIDLASDEAYARGVGSSSGEAGASAQQGPLIIVRQSTVKDGLDGASVSSQQSRFVVIWAHICYMNANLCPCTQ